VPTTELSVLVRDKLVPILTEEALSRVRKQAQLSSLYSVVLDDPLAAEGRPSATSCTGIAGLSVLNPQVAVMGGKQQSKRHRGAHEGKGKFAAAKPAAAAAGKRARKAPAAPP